MNRGVDVVSERRQGDLAGLWRSGLREFGRERQGILGIGAALLGALHVIGVDVHAPSLSLAAANAALFEGDLPVCAPPPPALALLSTHRSPPYALI